MIGTNTCTGGRIATVYLIRKPSSYMVKKYGYDEALKMSIKQHGIHKVPQLTDISKPLPAPRDAIYSHRMNPGIKTPFID
jgi:hypothetical protein